MNKVENLQKNISKINQINILHIINNLFKKIRFCNL